MKIVFIREENVIKVNGGTKSLKKKYLYSLQSYVEFRDLKRGLENERVDLQRLLYPNLY